MQELLGEVSRRKPARTGSLIITVFGDSVAQHGNSIWLGSLIRLLQPFGLNPRQIRTAVFRLAREDWLVARQVGRKSYYSLSESGLRQCSRAARRIYAARQPAWDGRWTLVLVAALDGEERDQLRRELLWLGYGTLSPGVLAHPTADRSLLDEVLQRRRAAPPVVVFEARTPDPGSADSLRTLCQDCWGLDALAARYLEFVRRFRPVYQALQSSAAPLAEDRSFQLRTLLIHEYRRILLHDTDLPDELLPANWTGRMAFNLTGNLYRGVEAGAERYLAEAVETIDGGLPPPDHGYLGRFGGLAAAPA